MEPVTLTQNVEIILTPQFYTFIREELDIKFSYQARQIAAALFDDYIDSSIEHQYHVTKCDNAWCFYAYNIEEIELFLKSIGIEKHRVSKIYFAQALSKELIEPVQLSEKNALKTIEGTVTLIPIRLLGENVYFKPLELSNLKLTGVSMGASHSSLISLKETIILSSLFFLLGVTFIVEGSRVSSSIKDDNEQLTALLDENPNYGSTMLRENILQKYQPIDQQERAKRANIKNISKVLSAKSELSSLKIEKSTIKASIITSDSSISKQVLKSAKAKKFKSSSSGNTITMEKSL